MSTSGESDADGNQPAPAGWEGAERDGPAQALRARSQSAPTAAAVTQSRVFVREMLELWKVDDLHAAAELLTTELVANVVRHAMTEIDLELIWDAPRLRIAVSDGSVADPVLNESPGEHGGFGLRIIAGIADAAGVERRPDGKVVWCELVNKAKDE